MYLNYRFYEKYGMPGVLGCLDGTLVAILAPRNHISEAAFFSRKGYHAINAAIVSIYALFNIFIVL